MAGKFGQFDGNSGSSFSSVGSGSYSAAQSPTADVGSAAPTAGNSAGGVLPTSAAGGYSGSDNWNPSASTDDGKGPGGHNSVTGASWFADGGGIPSPDNATEGDNQPVDFTAALSAVQNALSFGRQKNGFPSSGSMGGSGGAALDQTDGTGASKFQDPSFTPTQTSYAGGGGVLDNPVKKPAGMSPATYKDNPTLPMGPQLTLPKWIKKNEDPVEGDTGGTQNFAEGGAVGADDGDEDDVSSAATAQASPPAAGQSEQTSDQGVLPQPGSQQAAPQGQPQGGAQGGAVDPKKLVGYATGADGVTPEIATAMEARVDPQGQMDPSERKLLAIGQAGGAQQAWGLMQHYRQKYNAYSAFARAAAQGGQQKPADLNASAKAATDAYANVPDGTSLTFQPTRGGMAVQVRQLANKNSDDNKSQQSFEDGGPVSQDDDNTPEPDPGVIPTDVSSVNKKQVPLPPSDPRGPAVASGTQDAAPAKNSLSPNGTNPVRSFVLSIPQYLQFLTKDGQFDKVVEGGANTALDTATKNTPATAAWDQPQGGVHFQGAPSQLGQSQQAAPAAPAQRTPAIDPTLERQADALFPRHSKEWQNFITGQMTEQAGNQNKLDVAEKTWGGRTAVQDKRNEGGLARTQVTAASRQNVAQTTQQGVSQRAAQANMTHMIDTLVAGQPGIKPEEIAKRIAPFAAKAGTDPMQAVRDYFQPPQQQQAPAPQGQQQAPAQGGTQLPPQALQALKEGQVTVFKNGQKWKLQGGQPVQVQ